MARLCASSRFASYILGRMTDSTVLMLCRELIAATERAESAERKVIELEKALTELAPRRRSDAQEAPTGHA
jgi:hypothetical protein